MISSAPLRVLGRLSSINVRKVTWTCAEAGLACEREDWGTGFRSVQDPEFLRLNPNGLVPVLVDGNFVLSQSNAICRYLAAKQARPDLYPASPQARALVDQWLDWQLSELNGSWRAAFLGLVRKQAEYQDPAAISASITTWNRRMQVLEQQLASTGAWVTGETFTLADIALGLSVHRWRSTPMQHAHLPHVQEYLDRICSRAAWRASGAGDHP